MPTNKIPASQSKTEILQTHIDLLEAENYNLRRVLSHPIVQLAARAVQKFEPHTKRAVAHWRNITFAVDNFLTRD